MDNFNNQFLNALDSAPVSNKLAQIVKEAITSCLKSFDKKLEDMKVNQFTSTGKQQTSY